MAKISYHDSPLSIELETGWQVKQNFKTKNFKTEYDGYAYRVVD